MFVALLSTGIYLLSPRIAVFCRCSVGLLFFAQLFHECLDIDVVHAAAFDVRDRAVLTSLPQKILRQPRGLAGFRNFLEWNHRHYLLVKAPAHGGKLESELRSALLTLYQFNNNGQDTKMRTLRILGELVSTLDAKDQEKLVSYGEFLDAQSQKKRGISMEHPYQRE